MKGLILKLNAIKRCVEREFDYNNSGLFPAVMFHKWDNAQTKSHNTSCYAIIMPFRSLKPAALVALMHN